MWLVKKKKKISIKIKQDSGRFLHGCCVLQVEIWFFKKTSSWTRKQRVQSPYSSGTHVWRGKAFLSLKPWLSNCKAPNLFHTRWVLWRHASLISKSLSPFIWKPTQWWGGWPSAGPQTTRLGVPDRSPAGCFLASSLHVSGLAVHMGEDSEREHFSLLCCLDWASVLFSSSLFLLPLKISAPFLDLSSPCPHPNSTLVPQKMTIPFTNHRMLELEGTWTPRSWWGEGDKEGGWTCPRSLCQLVGRLF